VSDAAAGKASRTRWELARTLLAVVILVLVGRSVPWHDVLVVPLPDGQSAELEGLIDGEWKADSIRFRITRSEAKSTPEGSSATLAGWRNAGCLLAVERGSARVLEPASLAGEAIEGSFAWRPGIPRAFRELDAAGLLPALGFLILGSIFAATRWWRLLDVLQCTISWGQALRLTYVGLFFNLVVPGLNGGDVARGVLIVRQHPEQRAPALTSVIVDRLLGLLAMIALATLAVIGNRERLPELVLPVTLTLAGLVLGLVTFLNPRVRRVLRFDAILERLPQADRLRRLDDALVQTLRSPATVVLALAFSVGNHLAVTACVMSVGRAFGDTLGFLDYLCVVTVTNTLVSLPVSPAGWGVGEAAFRSFFLALKASPTLGVATSVTYRLCMAALSLAGGATLLLPGDKVARADLTATES